MHGPGRTVRIHEVIDRAAGLLARCSLIGSGASHAEEVPRLDVRRRVVPDGAQPRGFAWTR